MDDIRSLYLRTLHGAMARAARGDSRSALQGFLTLNAAYFLGEWLPPSLHRSLVRRIAARLDGIAGLSPPNDQVTATQLAQHARELAAAFGDTVWTDRMIAATVSLVPAGPEDWDAAVRPAIETVAAGGDGRALLLGHARRRLWELAHPDGRASGGREIPQWALRYAERAAAGGGAGAVQVAEALLAELRDLSPGPSPRRGGEPHPGESANVSLRDGRTAARFGGGCPVRQAPLPCEGRGRGRGKL